MTHYVFYQCQTVVQSVSQSLSYLWHYVKGDRSQITCERNQGVFKTVRDKQNQKLEIMEELQICHCL